MSDDGTSFQGRRASRGLTSHEHWQGPWQAADPQRCGADHLAVAEADQPRTLHRYLANPQLLDARIPDESSGVHLGEQPQQLEASDWMDDRDIEQAVVRFGLGADEHAAAVRARVPDGPHPPLPL